MTTPFSSGKGTLEIPAEGYGESVNGLPLRFVPSREETRILVIAGIHGEEPETTVILSRALRCLGRLPKNVAAVLAANPDGLLLGTRGNANGVDLNRNFDTRDWQSDPIFCRWHVDEADTFALETGSAPASEPETQALASLIEKLQPEGIFSLHAPLGCVDDPLETPAGKWLSERTGLPLVKEIGYPTPGSMGTWASENKFPIITWEFPRLSIEELSRVSVPILYDLLGVNGFDDF